MVYVVRDIEPSGEALITTDGKLTLRDLWHKRLSHISIKWHEELEKQGILPKGVSEEVSFL